MNRSREGHLAADGDEPRPLRPILGLIGGALACLVILALPEPAGMTTAAWRVVAVAVLMTSWWATEALPVAVTALMPLVLFPLLGVADVRRSAEPYADPVIFLFFGGLVLGSALQRWNLHRRIAMHIIGIAGLALRRLIFGFMMATAFLSMWVSNTATAAMMLPVTLSIVTLLVGGAERIAQATREERHFVLAVMLGVPFAASIGGLGTLIGTPPNALFAAFMRRTYGIDIGFAQWMMIGVPVGIVLLLATWVILTRIAFRVAGHEPPGLRERVAAASSNLGPVSRPEALVAVVFVGAALAWIFRPLLATIVPVLDDTVIAIAAAVALFIIPSGRGGPLMDWDATQRLPWGVLILFGGGLSLAAAMTASGLAEWLGEALSGLGGMPPVVLVLALVLITIALSELASNTAATAAFLPLAAALADGLGLAPFDLTLPIVLAASCGFMLPVATPPNALFYSSGYLTVPQMARAGFLTDLAGAAIVTSTVYLLLRLAVGS